MDRIVFPEVTDSIRQGRRPLALRHVLGFVYIFGGASCALALLSKFVIQPLFEELTYERRVFAEDARQHLLKLNALLAETVSRVPEFQAVEPQYVESAERTGDDMTVMRAAHERSAGTEQILAGLRELRQLSKAVDANDDIQRNHSMIVSQAEELSGYGRSLQYEAVPGTIFAGGPLHSTSSNDENDFNRSLINAKKEIRALKSSILSLQ